METTSIRDQLRALLIHEVAPKFHGTLDEQRAALDEMGTAVPAGTLVERSVIAGVPVEQLTPAFRARRVVLYAHGGGFAMGSCKSHRGLAAQIGAACRARVVLPEYRLAPEHPFPAGLDDLVAVYRALLANGTSADQIVIAGDSAGGNLAAATALRLRELGVELPRAIVMLSPWLDLSGTGESIQTRAALDPWLAPEMLGGVRECYMAGAEIGPLASPLRAELAGLPPMLIQVGDHEILLSDAERMHERGKAAGVEVELQVYPEVWHVFQLFAPMLPEACAAMERIQAFVDQQFSTRATRFARVG